MADKIGGGEVQIKISFIESLYLQQRTRIEELIDVFKHNYATTVPVTTDF
jgi:hypothetical protein